MLRSDVNLVLLLNTYKIALRRSIRGRPPAKLSNEVFNTMRLNFEQLNDTKRCMSKWGDRYDQAAHLVRMNSIIKWIYIFTSLRNH